MSIDLLHDKIRKLKNPVIVDFAVQDSIVPAYLLEQEGSVLKAQEKFCLELLDGLTDVVPGVRFSFDDFALFGADGLVVLSALLKKAGELGFFVFLDSPQILTPQAAQRAVDTFFGTDTFPCDGMIISPYIGSDAIRPFAHHCSNKVKSLFVVVRSPNKSASDLQDLLTGKRLVQGAAAELVNRFGEQILTKCGYSTICAAVSAGSPDSIRSLRAQHKHMFLLVDGLDYPSGNAKNCSYAFDRLGYGAAVSVGSSITAAWKDAVDHNPEDYVLLAQQAAERIKKNLLRYLTIL